MPTFRCPICGATHNKQVSQCRLCGADMTGRPIPVETLLSSAPPVSVKGGIKGIVLIGLGIVLLLVVAAVAFGVVRGNEVVSGVTNKVVPHEDGWSVQVEPDPAQPADTHNIGSFTVELPGDRTHETIDFVGTNDGKITVWTAKIGNDSILQVGSGVVTPPPPGTAPTKPGEAPGATYKDQYPTQRLYLADKAHEWMAKNNLTESQVKENKEAGISGSAAYVVAGQFPNTTIAGKDAYTEIAWVLRGDKMYVLMVTSLQKNAGLLDKLIANFTITA